MSWYCVDITEDSELGGDYHRLCRKFQQAFIAAGAPPDMALFAQITSQDSVRKVYFSPGSLRYVKPLIDAHQGKACVGPDRTTVTLVFGVPDAGWSLLSEAETEAGNGTDEAYSVSYSVSEEVAPVRIVRPVAVAS